MQSITKWLRALPGLSQEELATLLLEAYFEVLKRRKNKEFVSQHQHEFAQNISSASPDPIYGSHNGGFHIGLGNGRVLSVQFHSGNYIDNRKPTLSDNGCRISSPNAEIGIFDHDSEFLPIEVHDQVRGWLTPDQVLAWALITAVLPVQGDAKDLLIALRERYDERAYEED